MAKLLWSRSVSCSDTICGDAERLCDQGVSRLSKPGGAVEKLLLAKFAKIKIALDALERLFSFSWTLVCPQFTLF